MSQQEEKLLRLIRVELSERRGVEEIGLAFLGGRLNLEPEVWILPNPSPSSSSSAVPRVETPRPSGGEASRGAPSGPSKAFKPTPVDFDFVIGNSSVKAKPRRAKAKKEVERAKAPASKKKGGQAALGAHVGLWSLRFWCQSAQSPEGIQRGGTRISWEAGDRCRC